MAPTRYKTEEERRAELEQETRSPVAPIAPYVSPALGQADKYSLLDPESRDPRDEEMSFETPELAAPEPAPAEDIVKRRLLSSMAPAPAPRQEDRDLNAVLANKNRQHLISGLGKSAETVISSIAGNKPNYETFNDQIRAAEGDASLYLKEKLGLRERKAAAAKGIADANAAWMTLVEANPKLAEKPGFKEAFFNASEVERGRVLSQSGIVARSASADADRDENRRLQHQRFEVTRNDSKEKFKAGLQAVQSRFGSQMAVNLGKLAAPYAELQSTFEGIERLAPGMVFGQVPDGYSYQDWERVKSDFGAKWGIPGRISDANADLMRNQLKNLRDQLARLRTGAVINESEEQAYKEMFNDAMLGSPDTAALALDMFRRNIATKFATNLGGYTVDPNLRPILEAYGQSGAASPMAEIWRKGMGDLGAGEMIPGGFDDVLGEFDANTGGAPDVPTTVEVQEPTIVPSAPAPARPKAPLKAPPASGPQPTAKVKVRDTEDGSIGEYTAEEAKKLLDLVDAAGKRAFEVIQ